MAISAKQVNELRKITGAGMMDCKKALVEAEGNIDTAIDILRKKGQKISAKRADREAAEGSVFVKQINDGKAGVLVALNCETDFVAKNEEFLALGQLILDVAVDNNAADVEAIKAVSVEGLSIEQRILDLVGKIGEKIEISNYVVLEADQVVPYVHFGNKLGVLVALSNTGDGDRTEAGKDVGMQIAAMNPVGLNADDVSPEIVEREKQLGIDKARQEGKPEHILEKISAGYVNKFFKDNCLLNQIFVKDNTKTVQQYLDSVSKGMTVASFKRVNIGG